MYRILILAALAAAPMASSSTLTVAAPEGWAASKDGTTFVFSPASKDVVLRVDLFEKKDAGDPKACLDQIIANLCKAEKTSSDSYSTIVVDGQPAATQTSVSADQKIRHRRIVGCNGKAYFLVNWGEDRASNGKYDKAYSAMLTSIAYARQK
jgi:hypothetical protein